MKNIQLNLFDKQNDSNDWREHYVGMPEYNNTKEPEPFIVATFKFKSQNDFNEFNKLIKQYLYNGQKVFDGMQRKEAKSAWYPLKPKASKFKFL